MDSKKGHLIQPNPSWKAQIAVTSYYWTLSFGHFSLQIGYLMWAKDLHMIDTSPIFYFVALLVTLGVALRLTLSLTLNWNWGCQAWNISCIEDEKEKSKLHQVLAWCFFWGQKKVTWVKSAWLKSETHESRIPHQLSQKRISYEIHITSESAK